MIKLHFIQTAFCYYIFSLRIAPLPRSLLLQLVLTQFFLPPIQHGCFFYCFRSDFCPSYAGTKGLVSGKKKKMLVIRLNNSSIRQCVHVYRYYESFSKRPEKNYRRMKKRILKTILLRIISIHIVQLFLWCILMDESLNLKFVRRTLQRSVRMFINCKSFMIRTSQTCGLGKPYFKSTAVTSDRWIWNKYLRTLVRYEHVLSYRSKSESLSDRSKRVGRRSVHVAQRGLG